MTEPEIKAAKTLAESSITCEAFREEEEKKGKDEKKHNYITIEDYTFEYEGKIQTFKAAVGFDNDSTWGEIALYPANADLTKINYGAGSFNDLGTSALYLATLKFEYVPSTEKHPAYFILERIDAAYSARKVCSQICVSYFINRFIKDHTSVKFIFSDARQGTTKQFFPKYGLQSGIPETFKEVKFSRPFRSPFYWERPTEK